MLLYLLGYSVKSVNKINAKNRVIYISLHIENGTNENYMTYQLSSFDVVSCATKKSSRDEITQT